MTVDAAALERQVDVVSTMMSSHLGSIEVVDVSPRGEVRVRFLGLCAGCPLKPLTLASTVRPALLDVEGVTHVDAIGARVSEEAARRLAGTTQHTPLNPEVER